MKIDSKYENIFKQGKRNIIDILVYPQMSIDALSEVVWPQIFDFTLDGPVYFMHNGPHLDLIMQVVNSKHGYMVDMDNFHAVRVTSNFSEMNYKGLRGSKFFCGEHVYNRLHERDYNAHFGRRHLEGTWYGAEPSAPLDRHEAIRRKENTADILVRDSDVLDDIRRY